VIVPRMDTFLNFDSQALGSEAAKLDKSLSEKCAKIKELGFSVSKHIKMYGEHFEIISDPFLDGNCIAVRATAGHDPAIRTLRLPSAFLVGLADRFHKRSRLGERKTQ
jgi:hypothetical protein